MAAILIRKVNEKLKSRLRVRAAQRGRSMEAEARDILLSALSEKGPRLTNLATTIRARFKSLGDVKLPKTPRQPMRKSIEFER